MKEEKWLPIVGYESLYEVSDLGRVRSLETFTYRGKGRNRLTLKGRIRALRSDAKGYLYVNLAPHHDSDGYRRGEKSFGVHRLVALAFIGPAPLGQNDVNHIDFNPANNTPGNLEWTSRQENTMHSSKSGRLTPRVIPSKSPLTAEDVLKIRALAAAGVIPQSQIGAAFGVGQQTVSRISRGDRWGFLPRVLITSPSGPEQAP